MELYINIIHLDGIYAKIFITQRGKMTNPIYSLCHLFLVIGV